MKTEIPEIYLSKNEAGWCLIYRGMPLCAMTSETEARQSAARFKLKLPEVFWDGETGRFEPFCN